MTRRELSLDDWRLSDRDPVKVAAVAAVVLALVLGLALNWSRLPLVSHHHGYSAYLEAASGLEGGETVQVRGVRVGKVTGVTLVDAHVRVDFEVDDDVRLGRRSEARVKVLNPLGSQFLEVRPLGPGRLDRPIPQRRTAVSRALVTELGRVSDRIEGIDVEQLQRSLKVAGQALSGTTAEAMSRALTGLNAFAGNLAEDSDDLRTLITEGSDLAHLLRSRQDELVNIVAQGDALAQVLTERRAAIRRLIRGTADLSAQVSSILRVNREELTPMLRNIQRISRALAQENAALGRSIPAMAQLSDNVARVTGTGRFADVVVPNGLVPDNVIKACGNDARYPAPRKPAVGCRP